MPTADTSSEADADAVTMLTTNETVPESADEASSSSSETDQIERRLGRYLLLRTLGEGGMGRVYAAYDEELDRRVAIKVLHAHLGGAAVHQARMQREARALARISHPNVVAMYDVGTVDEGRLFLAMEFVRGETLSAWQAKRDPNDEADRRELLEMYIQAGRGVAAAHEHGLVHRDFKPANVIVGDDGRARVLDFGLVVPVGGGGRSGQTSAVVDDDAFDVNAPMLTPALTAAGTVMGTPMYMAPEQFRGDAADERTDQFNFCASLYRALYKAPALDGHNFASLLEASLEGRVREPPASSRVPEWLHAVVRRGLAHAPGDRYPSMVELLDALARDPIRRRRRRTAMALVLSAVALLSTALVFAGIALVERWEQRQREDAAFERLAALDAALDDPGLDAEPRRLAFEAFVNQRDNWGTDALALAWLHEAKRGRAGSDAIVAAYAQAYVLARADATRTTALLGLARHFRANLRWQGLARALALLELDPDDMVPDAAELRRFEFDSALARRNIGMARLRRVREGGNARRDAVLRELGRGTPTSHARRDDLHPIDLDGDGARELISVRPGELQVFAGDVSLTPREQLAIAGRYHQIIPSDRGALFVASDRVMTHRDATLLSFEDGELVERLSWPEHVVLSAIAHDLDGDGRDEIYVGSGPYTRHLLELVPGTGERWSTRAAAPVVDRRDSNITAMVAADLDGDGHDELLLAHGPWSGYSLRVLRRAPHSTTLDSIARVRLGDVHSLALLDHDRAQAGEIEIFAATGSGAEPPPTFAFDLPDPTKPGLYGFVFRDGQLQPTRRLSLPELGPDRVAHIEAIRAGDLDGDGHDELIVNTTIEPQGSASFTVYTFDERGGHEAFTLADADVLGVVDLDGDGDDELLTWLVDQQRVWIVGTGDEPLPTLAVPTPSTEPPELADPVLARVWARAEELQAMGLGLEAAASFATFAAQSRDDELEVQALLRAGELIAAQGDDLGAAQLYTQAVRAASPPSAEAALAAAEHHRRRGELEAALAVLDQPFAAGEPREADLVQARRELELLLSPGRDHRLGFAGPLTQTWAIHEPTSLRRDALTGHLHVDANTRRTLLSRPVREDAQRGLVLLEADLDFERAGWGSALDFRLVDEVGRSIARVGVSLHGGSSDLDYRMNCSIGEGAGSIERTSYHPGPEGPPGRVTLRLVWDRAHGEAICRVRDDAGRELLYRRFDTHDAPVGALDRLELGSDSLTGLHATLYSLRFTGLELLGLEPSSDVAAWLVEGDYVRVLEATSDAVDPQTRLWRIIALARLARPEAASSELTALAETPENWATIEPELLGRAVAEPVLFSPVLALALGPERRVELLVRAWSRRFEVNRDDVLATRVLHDALAQLGPSPRTEQLALRAAVHSRLHDHEAAADDYARALELVLAGGGVGVGDTARQRDDADALRVRIAREILATGDEARARALVAALLASPEGVERNGETIADDTELAPLLPDR